MWTQEVWGKWATEVERISGGAWVPEPTHGTFTHTPSGGDKFHLHVTLHGSVVITSWGTPAGNDAKTALDADNDAAIIASAQRWVKGPGAVRLAKFAAAREARDKVIADKAVLQAHAESLVAHMAGRGLSAHFWEGGLSSARADVRVTSDDAHLSLDIYPSRTVYVNRASGTPRGIEILVAAVDDWASLTPAAI